jgi:hypothetical protein
MNDNNPTELDPRRDPAWRWARADRGPGIGGTDPTVRMARRYRRAWEACRTDADRQWLAARMPDLFAAHALYRDPAGRARAAVELRVLADQPAADVARAGGLPVTVVETFEAVFFDVRSRLAARDFIGGVVAGTGGDDTAWRRWLAYVGGPAVVDDLLGAAPAAARPGRPEDVPAFLDAVIAGADRRQAAAAALDPNRPTGRAVIARSGGRVVGQPRGGEEDRPHPVFEHIKAMLEEIPWSYGRKAELLEAENPALAAADHMAVELRDDELRRLAAGEEVPGLEELATFKLPPPRKEKRSILLDELGQAGPASAPAPPAPPRRPGAAGPNKGGPG